MRAAILPPLHASDVPQQKDAPAAAGDNFTLVFDAAPGFTDLAACLESITPQGEEPQDKADPRCWGRLRSEIPVLDNVTIDQIRASLGSPPPSQDGTIT
ncbi:MAG TPA: hypothetical protein VMU54_00950 [Planctomycetota bacterium]|nr:hypothetical protein [Planctomycetota bacterium]